MTKTIHPAPSYEIDLPSEVQEDVEDRVNSFWITEDPLLLQVSSYLRSEGPQLSARLRLEERMARGGRWRIWSKHIHPDPTIEQATAETLIDDTLWIHSYFVWPHLTIYCTVSGPSTGVDIESNWAIKAISTLRLIKH